MKSTSCTFYSWGEACSAVLWLPDAVDSECASPGIIMCHGFRGIKEWFLPPIAEKFADAGFAVLTFDYRGFGGSEGTRGRLLPQAQVEDIRHAITFMQSRNEVDGERIGLWGTSFGCAVGLHATAVDQRIRAMVGLAGPGSMTRIISHQPLELQKFLQSMIAEDMERRATTGAGKSIDPAVLVSSKESQEAYEEAEQQWPQIKTEFPLDAVARILEYEPEKFASQIAPRPLLLIGAEKDKTVPPQEMCHIFEKAMSPKELKMFPVGHYELYRGACADAAVTLATDWFNTHLKLTQECN